MATDTELRNHAEWVLVHKLVATHGASAPYGNEDMVAYAVVSTVSANVSAGMIPAKEPIAMAAMEQINLLLQRAGLHFEVGQSREKRNQKKMLVYKVIEDLSMTDPELQNGVWRGLLRVLEDL